MPNQRDKNKKKISVWMTDKEQKLLEEAAKEQGYKNLPDFLRAVADGTIKLSVKLVIGLCLLAKLMSDPTDWSAEALAGAAGQGCVWFGQGLYFVASLGWQALS